MDSEIILDAMFDSIGDSISQIQRLMIKIKAQFIQRIALELVSKLDEIERYRNIIPRGNHYSNHIPSTIKKKIDSLKLEAIGKLHALRREGNISIQLPTTIRTDHFYSIEEANESPSK